MVVSVVVDQVVAIVLALMEADHCCYHLVALEVTELVVEALVDHWYYQTFV